MLQRTLSHGAVEPLVEAPPLTIKVCVCVCVCVRERERERESVCVRESVCERVCV